MSGKANLHKAEKKLFISAARFAKLVRNQEFSKASTLMAGVAGSFAALAFETEASFSAVVNELSDVLDLIDEAWNAVDNGVSDVALNAYAQIVRIMPDAHIKVEQVLLAAQADGDPGSRGNDKNDLVQAAHQTLKVIGVA